MNLLPREIWHYFGQLLNLVGNVLLFGKANELLIYKLKKCEREGIVSAIIIIYIRIRSNLQNPLTGQHFFN